MSESNEGHLGIDARVARYEIRVTGVLDTRWTTWFNELEIKPEGDDVSVIAGPVVDQAELYGLLLKVRDLGLALISVTRVGDPEAQSE